MKIYEIINEYEGMPVGTLLYYEKEHEFIIELCDNLDEWTAPILLSAFVKKGEYTIPRDISILWVKERVVPGERQNIGIILRNHKIKSYDEMKLLEVAEGRCSQDDLAIRRISDLPDYVRKRMDQNVADCTTLSDNNLLVFFVDGTVRKISLLKLKKIDGIDSVIKNEKLFRSGKVGTGGYSVTFNDSIDIPASLLYRSGELIPLSTDEFMEFVRRNVLDTSKSCELLSCSRQNLSYMVKQDQLAPIKEEVKGNIYLKGDIIRNTW